MPDKRERGALDTVNKLVGQFDRERDREYGKRRPSTSSETHVRHASAATPATPGAGTALATA
jgi:hypothetical protein